MHTASLQLQSMHVASMARTLMQRIVQMDV